MKKDFILSRAAREIFVCQILTNELKTSLYLANSDLDVHTALAAQEVSLIKPFRSSAAIRWTLISENNMIKKTTVILTKT